MLSQQHHGNSKKRLASVLAALAVLCALLPIEAAAQQRVERRNLLDMLFGGGRTQRMQPAPQDNPPYSDSESVREYRAPERVIRRRPASSPAKPAAARAAPQPDLPATKLVDARKILVVGDFLAGGLGDGLDAAFQEAPDLIVETRSNIASGLVRDDYYNWPAELTRGIAEVKPALLVVMVGANDRQQMATDAAKEKFGTEEWFAAYETRVAAFAAIAAKAKVPLLWVGLPAFQSPAATADSITLNAIYKAQIEKSGGEFIDIWDGFVDESGRFVATGSDLSGQPVRLRGADGVNFTAAGKRKLAFYVEKPARRQLGERASPELTRLDASNLPDLINLPPSEIQKIIQTQPISLSDPDLDGGAELLGGGKPPAAAPIQSPRDRLVERGEMAPAPAGRIDNYRLSTASRK
jgi:hypothetical protein